MCEIIRNHKFYKTVLFDLDGTISDPKLGVVNAIVYACQEWGITDYTKEEFLKFIGPPLHLSFKNRFNLSDADAANIVKLYRVYYEEKGKFENELYPGIKELLKILNDSGRRIAVATSKPTFFSEQIIEHFGISEYIKVLVGSNLDNTMTEKEDIVREALLQLGRPKKAECVMIGDRKFDILGAKANEIDSISVLYGYGSQAEFDEYQPTYIIDTVDNLTRFLLY